MRKLNIFIMIMYIGSCVRVFCHPYVVYMALSKYSNGGYEHFHWLIVGQCIITLSTVALRTWISYFISETTGLDTDGPACVYKKLRNLICLYTHCMVRSVSAKVQAVFIQTTSIF